MNNVDYTTVYKCGDIIIGTCSEEEAPELMKIECVHTNFMSARGLGKNYARTVVDASIKNPTEDQKAVVVAYETALRNLEAANAAIASEQSAKK